MSERIVYHPWKLTAVASVQRDGATDHAAVSRPFADILAEAEAVRDPVQLNGPAAMESWSALAAGKVQSTLALLMRPLYAPMVAERLRRGTAAADSTSDEHA